jgi:hypothetical protein
MASKSILEKINPKGHLEIIKTSLDGTSEVLLDDHNVITIGMGVTLASLFSNSVPATSIDKYLISYLQIGTGSKSMVSGTDSLQTPLDNTGYGTTNLTFGNHRLSTGADQWFVHLNSAYISKPSSSKIAFTLLIDEDTANTKTITEIGLFSKNPTAHTPETAYMCAYRSFTGIAKSSEFSLTFKWTIEF